MSKCELIPLNRYRWNGHEVKLIELTAGRAYIELPGDRGIRDVPVGELEALPTEASYSAHSRMIIPQEEWNKLVKIRDACVRIEDLTSGTTEATHDAAEELGCHPRQMFRYREAYRVSQSIFALRNAKCGRPTGTKLLGQEREDIVAKAIEEHYLKREPATIAQLCDAIAKLCTLANLPAPSRDAVELRVARIGLEIKIRRRKGGKAAKEATKGVPGHLRVDHPLQRIEIDHTLVDVILCADTPGREVVGRPWVTLAIDCATRMILGFYISFERPSASSVAACLAMVAMSKDSWLSETGVVGAWPALGIPQEIWVDNAMEFRSEALRRGCEQHQILLNYRPVGSPEYGGTIESLIGTMMGYVHLLPGTTQRNVAERGDYDSEQRAMLTLSEFIPWFTEQVVTQYHLRTHRVLGMCPLSAWELAAPNCEIRTPRDPLEYFASFLPAEKRKLTRAGVHFHNMNYWNDEFLPWVGHGLKVLTHYNQMDAAQVFVRLPNGRIVPAKVQQHGIAALTLADKKNREEAVRSIAKNPKFAKASAEGWQRNQQRLDDVEKRHKKARRTSKVEDVVLLSCERESDLLLLPEEDSAECFFIEIEEQEHSYE